MTKLPELVPDDPLRTASNPSTSPEPTSDRPPEPERPTTAAEVAPDAPEPERPPAHDVGEPLWAAGEEEEWSGSTDVTTVRVPVEVLRAMRERSRDLGLPKGMILTAGMLDVLARSDDELIERVEATQLRYDRARRRASRAI